MKLHYTKILLFSFPLNILAHNKNKPSITSHHTPIYTSRLLSECDTESSIYDNDEDMESVKEIFERQTSQRFEEYQERMKEKRQKRKEQRDKNIQKIIQKDKREKSLAEKIEKGCLRCGCGLGGVAGSIGLFGGVAINMWKPWALDAAIKAALEEGAAYISATAKAAGDAVGAAKVVAGLKELYVLTLDGKDLGTYFATTSYKNVASIYEAVSNQYIKECTYDSLGYQIYRFGGGNRHIAICNSVWQQTSVVSERSENISYIDVINRTIQNIVTKAEEPAKAASDAAEKGVIAKITEQQTNMINTIFMSKQTAIIASVVAIIVIVLIMLIIYLILRYRRKKKMKKKAQYTKLLNE
ncbi:rifin [Plasmodium reichenowi]|uniref:Rifin n=1 Tax=Plasmodium reichenowi TaxID=5854 RepID=A0A060RMX0_PLARE|nr:rifin [Plasmodium reichenowi]